MWDWLAGKKTYIVMVLIFLCEVAKKAKPEWGPALDEVIKWLSGLGAVTVAHRVARATREGEV